MEIYLLLSFMIVAAIIAVAVKDLVSGVVAIGAVGIGLSMTFLVLKAPDLAMMQLVVEILSLIILVRATIRKDLPFSTSGRWVFNTISTIVFLAAFLVSAFFAIKNMPPFGDPIMWTSKTYIQEAMQKTGSHNIVSAIMLNYRVFDTLGEATALFASMVGILAIARKIPRNKEI